MRNIFCRPKPTDETVDKMTHIQHVNHCAEVVQNGVSWEHLKRAISFPGLVFPMEGHSRKRGRTINGMITDESGELEGRLVQGSSNFL